MRIRIRSIYLAQYMAFAGVMGLLMPSAPHAQENSAKQSDPEMVVRVARVLNVRSGSYIKSAAIWVEGERIKAVGRETDVLKEAPAAAQILDLGDVTVLPGLIDCHTHLMARLPDAGRSARRHRPAATYQVRDEGRHGHQERFERRALNE